MRNLKKILALVLALMMIVSMMVFASASSYGDTDQVNPAYEEAVDVLTGMGVFEGYAGEFHPTDNVTRAQVSAVLYRAMTADVNDVQSGLYKGYGDFSDVGANQWYAGYVGYMANGEWIVGDGQGHYMPESNVTGYQLLKIVLRAIGYGENNEFVGGGWDLRVATLAKELGITDGFQGESLNDPLTREEVAYLVFNALFVQKVKYTPAMNYDPRTDATTIGYDEFGLDYTYGIVVGNQATGETVTKISWTNAGVAYTYGDAWGFNTTTGLDLFGHQVKVWYDVTSSTSNLTTYALADKATNAQTVIASDANLAQAGDLYKAVVTAGFSENTTTAYWSGAYATFSGSRLADSAGGKTATNLYQVISNNALGTVDVVIKVDAQIAQISKLDTTAKVKTLTLSSSDYSGDGEIALEDVVAGESYATLGNVVIVEQITGTNSKNTDGVYGYQLDDLANTVVGKVSNYDSTTGVVTLSDGTELEQSPLYGVVKSGITKQTTYSNTTYVFTMDNNGKYLGAELYNDNAFLYGTFADYESAGVGTGTVKYYMTGVDLNGNIVTNTDVTAYMGNNPSSTYTGLAVTKKTWGSNSITAGTNTGYAIDSNGNLTTSLSSVGVQKMNNAKTFDTTDAANGYMPTTTSNKVFFTNSTKFIVVTGTGTDSLKVDVFNGISGLLGDADSVTIATNTGTGSASEVYYTTSDYIYNNVLGATEQIDVMILPADALTYTNSSSVYYCNDATAGAVDTKTGATKYELYVGGVASEYYLTSAPTVDTFYVLTESGTAADGATVYSISTPAANTGTDATYTYVGATNNLDTAVIGSTLRTVTGATVVNLVDPDMALNSLADLNNAVSTGYTVTVAYVYNNAGAVTTIYVTAATRA